MVLQQVDPVEGFPERGHEIGCRVDVLVRIVAGRDDGIPQDQVFLVAEHTDVFQNGLVGNGGEPFMDLIVHMFHITADMVEIGQEFADFFQALPNDLQIVLKYAYEHDIELILLDSDACEISELPTYEW